MRIIDAAHHFAALELTADEMPATAAYLASPAREQRAERRKLS
jgi:hypothetical protein